MICNLLIDFPSYYTHFGLCLPSSLVFSRFLTKILYTFLISPMHVTCLICLIVLDFIILIITGGQYKFKDLWSCIFLQDRIARFATPPSSHIFDHLLTDIRTEQHILDLSYTRIVDQIIEKKWQVFFPYKVCWMTRDVADESNNSHIKFYGPYKCMFTSTKCADVNYIRYMAI